MKILLTGFQPFGGACVNPSWEAVKDFDGSCFSCEVVTACLPVEWGRVKAHVDALIEQHRPDCVILTGQAGGRAGISVERLAVNRVSQRPDNAGMLPPSLRIVEGGPAELVATYPQKRILSALQEAGIEATLSDSAGGYICNYTLYLALLLAKDRYPHMQVGFLHLPYLPEQTHDKPTMGLKEQKRAIGIVIDAVLQANTLENKGDILL